MRNSYHNSIFIHFLLYLRIHPIATVHNSLNLNMLKTRTCFLYFLWSLLSWCNRIWIEWLIFSFTDFFFRFQKWLTIYLAILYRNILQKNYQIIHLIPRDLSLHFQHVSLGNIDWICYMLANLIKIYNLYKNILKLDSICFRISQNYCKW